MSPRSCPRCRGEHAWPDCPLHPDHRVPAGTYGLDVAPLTALAVALALVGVWLAERAQGGSDAALRALGL